MLTESLVHSKTDYTGYNDDIDDYSASHLLALRVYLDKHADESRFFQLQIRKCVDDIYQLDFYDEGSEECNMILFTDITCLPASFDVAYASNKDSAITRDDYLSGGKLITLFVDAIINLRIYAWDYSINEDGNYYPYSIEPLPVLPNFNSKK
jgi:hypothetical protein